jgi:predicted PurR-regulated permease PerM
MLKSKTTTIVLIVLLLLLLISLAGNVVSFYQLKYLTQEQTTILKDIIQLKSTLDTIGTAQKKAIKSIDQNLNSIESRVNSLENWSEDVVNWSRQF